MGRKFSSWVFCAASSLGVFFGISIFFVFTFAYNNNHAGTWGLISALFAGLCLHLHLLSSENRLSGWYSAPQLTAIAAFAFICFTFALGFSAWYLIYAVYHHIPMLPVKTSSYLAAVWAGMSAKWTFTLFLLSYRYSRILRYNTPFLIIQENA